MLKTFYKILLTRQNRDERQLYNPHHDVTGYNGGRLHLFSIKLIVKANGQRQSIVSCFYSNIARISSWLFTSRLLSCSK